MMPRRSFLEAAVWLAAAGSLAGCSSDGTAGFARGSAPGPVTADTPIYDVINNPLLDGYGRLLFPTTLHPPTEDMTLDDLSACLPWYSEIHTSTTVDVVSYLLSERAAERTFFYDIYTDAEKAADPSLANTRLFRFAAEGAGGASAPFAVVSAGGGFAYVAAMHDSFPHCLHLARSGVNGFAVIYRPDAQLACEDLARAVSFIFEHADELSVDTSGYSLWGGSAGARMAAWVGGYGPAAFGAPVGTPQPAAAIMQYTGMSELTGADPATYACVGDRDGIASWRTMQARLEALSATGVPTEFHVYEGLSHGFGLGVDTVAEGWIDDALAFWKAQR